MISNCESIYSFEHRVENTSAGAKEVWHVVDAGRVDGEMVAICNSAADASLVVYALNAAAAETRLSVHD